MDATTQTQTFIDQAQKYLDSSLEGQQICHISFRALCAGLTDLRDALPELASLPAPVHPQDVVVDSDMTLHEAFRGLPHDCPAEILAQQLPMRVFYFGTDGKLHHGQIVIHQALMSDVSEAFSVLLRERIPVGSVIPVSDLRFEVDGKWDDYSSMEQNNSSGFNFRRIITADGVGKRLSLHGVGMALDINPALNPCYGSPLVHNLDGYTKEAGAGYQAFLPANGKYDLSHPGTLHERHPLVLTLERLGWTWGGRWADPKDLHHFQKIPVGLEEHVKRLRDP